MRVESLRRPFCADEARLAEVEDVFVRCSIGIIM